VLVPLGAGELWLSAGAGFDGGLAAGVPLEPGAGIALGVSCINDELEASPQAFKAAKTRTVLAAKSGTSALRAQRNRLTTDAWSDLPGSISSCIAHSF
jgi:hypothetical protein